MIKKMMTKTDPVTTVSAAAVSALTSVFWRWQSTWRRWCQRTNQCRRRWDTPPWRSPARSTVKNNRISQCWQTTMATTSLHNVLSVHTHVYMYVHLCVCVHVHVYDCTCTTLCLHVLTKSYFEIFHSFLRSKNCMNIPLRLTMTIAARIHWKTLQHAPCLVNK